VGFAVTLPSQTVGQVGGVPKGLATNNAGSVIVTVSETVQLLLSIILTIY
jgi:hypothetical protein